MNLIAEGARGDPEVGVGGWESPRHSNKNFLSFKASNLL